MLLAAAALSLSLDLTNVAERLIPALQPKPVCSIRVVSHKFVGTPGSRVEYAGKTYDIPASGALELIAKKGVDGYRINGQTQQLGTSTVDEFGMDIVQLP